MTPVEIVIQLLKKYPGDTMILDLLDKLYQQELTHRQELKTATAPSHDFPQRSEVLSTLDAKRYEGLSIIAAAKRALKESGKPLSALEIARHAAQYGFKPGVELKVLRSRFAAVISNNKQSPNPAFVQIARGQIGLLDQSN